MAIRRRCAGGSGLGCRLQTNLPRGSPRECRALHQTAKHGVRWVLTLFMVDAAAIPGVLLPHTKPWRSFPVSDRPNLWIVNAPDGGWQLSSSSMVDAFLEDDGMIVRLILGSIEERHAFVPTAQSKGINLARHLIEFRAVSSSKYRPSTRVMTEPFPQCGLGAISFSQISMSAASFLRPRGQRRSMSTRSPSSLVAGSYVRLI